MKIGELTSTELAKRLRTCGLDIQAGPFIIRIQTDVSALERTLQLLYPDFNVADGDFADFHVQLKKRRWWRPQAVFLCDGKMPFYPLPLRLASPLLEWGLNWCIATQAHQYLIIHSAVLEREGRAMLLTGPPGSGKSTLAAALSHSGWRLLSDEIALIRPTDNRVVPIPKPVSLKNESIEIIQGLAPDSFMALNWDETHKGRVALVRPSRSSIDLACETALPSWIIFVTYMADAPVELRRMPKSRAFLKVVGNALNYSLLGATGFETTAGIVDMCDCYEFSYSNLKEAMRCLSQLKR